MLKLIKKILFFKIGSEPQIVLDLKSIDSKTPPDKIFQIKTRLWSIFFIMVLPLVLVSLLSFARGSFLAGTIPLLFLGVVFGPVVVFAHVYQVHTRRGGKPLRPTTLKAIILSLCLIPILLLTLLSTVSGFNSNGSSKYLYEDLLNIQ